MYLRDTEQLNLIGCEVYCQISHMKAPISSSQYCKKWFYLMQKFKLEQYLQLLGVETFKMSVCHCECYIDLLRKDCPSFIKPWELITMKESYLPLVTKSLNLWLRSLIVAS
eukprot:NODE_208_length_14728_cov_0.400164.p12 type:complete len:111 gc:universal NODE_208_length_14728_cov_0.400164:14332-14000(-)